jgi:hypothetical protein
MPGIQMLARRSRTALHADAAVRSSRRRLIRARRKRRLDRITIPQDAVDRIAGIASPRSSLIIISDEALSSETGKDTEFVVLMSGEPQGGIKFQRHARETKVRYELGRSPANLAVAIRGSRFHSVSLSFPWHLLRE